MVWGPGGLESWDLLVFGKFFLVISRFCYLWGWRVTHLLRTKHNVFMTWVICEIMWGKWRFDWHHEKSVLKGFRCGIQNPTFSGVFDMIFCWCIPPKKTEDIWIIFRDQFTRWWFQVSLFSSLLEEAFSSIQAYIFQFCGSTTEASSWDGKKMTFPAPSIHVEKKSWGSRNLGDFQPRERSSCERILKDWSLAIFELFGWWNLNFCNPHLVKSDPKEYPGYPLTVWLDYRVMGISVSYILISYPSNTVGSSEIRNPVDMVFYPMIYKEFYTSQKVVWWPDFWTINRLIRPKVRQTLWCWVLSLVSSVAAKLGGSEWMEVVLNWVEPTSQLNLGHDIFTSWEVKAC